MTKDLFNQIKLEAKTHTITYILVKHEFEGIRLTEEMITRIKNSKNFEEMGDIQSKT